MDELAFRRTVYQIAVSLMKWQLAVPFLLSSTIDIFVFMAAITGKPVSHKYVVKKKKKK
jgi:hypothetical protein